MSPRKVQQTRPPVCHLGARAFTLVEAVATISIISIVVVVASRSIFTAADSYASAATRAELVNSMSAAFERITVELRNIPIRPATLPAEPYLDSVDPAAVAWAGGTALSLSGTNLQLTTGGAARTLLDNVSALTIQAYDESDLALGPSLSGDACDPVRRLQLTMTTSKYGVSETVQCKVFLRCTMAGAAP